MKHLRSPLQIEVTRSSRVPLAILLVGLAFFFFFVSRWFSKLGEQPPGNAGNDFYNAQLNDTITRVDQLYPDSCLYQLWISNYSKLFVVVDVCKYPQLKDISAQTKIVKDSNSNACVFKKNETGELKLELEVVY